MTKSPQIPLKLSDSDNHMSFQAKQGQLHGCFPQSVVTGEKSEYELVKGRSSAEVQTQDFPELTRLVLPAVTNLISHFPAGRKWCHQLVKVDLCARFSSCNTTQVPNLCVSPNELQLLDPHHPPSSLASPHASPCRPVVSARAPARQRHTVLQACLCFERTQPQAWCCFNILYPTATKYFSQQIATVGRNQTGRDTVLLFSPAVAFWHHFL